MTMSLSAVFARPVIDKSIPVLPLHRSPVRTPPKKPHAPETLPSPARFIMTGNLCHSDALLALTREENHLQSTLQNLLDAQSEGLVAGLTGGPAQDRASSTGSRTPTTTDSTLDFKQPKSIVPVRQPPQRKIGLRRARNGIAQAISDLGNLKCEESRILGDEVAEREGIISTISGFERKSTGLRTQIQEIESEDTSRHVENLKAEERTLGNSIHDIETRLYEMKARHRHLIREIDGLNNSVQSKLSSYQSALSLAEKDIQRFLSRPPVETSTNRTTGVWALPKERRTLEMAKEHYNEEQQTLKAQREAVEAEQCALEEGKVVWEEVVRQVDLVEKSLREEMHRMQSRTARARKNETSQGMRQILQMMHNSRKELESKLDLAETNNWKLLVCCIGAELEALIEGQTVLEGALEASMAGQESYSEAAPKGNTGVHAAEGALIDDSTSVSSPQDLLSPTRGFLGRSEDEDDGPGPELLISQHE